MSAYVDLLRRQGLLGVLVAAFHGAVAAAALPPVHAVPLLLVAFPALLFQLGLARSWRYAALLGFGWAWGHHVAGLYWVTHAILVDPAWWWLVPFAAPALAFPLAVFVIPVAILAWCCPAGWPRVLVFSGSWTLMEMARGVLFTGFPWNLIGTVWSLDAVAIQAASVIGAYGLSLITVILACLPLLGRARPLAGGLVVLGVLAGWGAWRLGGDAVPVGRYPVLIVQGNVQQSVKWDPEERARIFDRYLRLTETYTRRALAAVDDFSGMVVVWPETASPFLLAQDPGAMARAAAALPPRSLLVAGTVRIEVGPDGKLARIFNSAVVLDDEGSRHALYDKMHLVPFGEYMPLAGLIPIRLAAGGMDFSAGIERERIGIGGAPSFGILICYEIIFPGAVTASQRPEWLANITNDAWFGTSAGPWQHLAAAQFRAVEEGLPIIRAAQTGISTAFDGFGRPGPALPLGAEGTVLVTLDQALEPTPFARFGLIIPFGMSISVLLLGVVTGLGRVASPFSLRRRQSLDFY